jgi:GNAT superfamily N-acetyltransferase
VRPLDAGSPRYPRRRFRLARTPGGLVDALPGARTLLAQSPATLLQKARTRLWSTRRSITVVLDLPPASLGPAADDLDVSFADPASVPDLTELAPETTGADLLTLAAIERTRAAGAGELVLAYHDGALAGVHFIHTAPDRERLERVAPGLYLPLEADDALTEGVFVVAAFRGRHVASAMLQTSARELTRRGYRRALAVVDVGNRPSLRAFAGAGFRPGATMRVDRLRFGRRTSRFVAAPAEVRRRYDAAVGARG